MNRDFVIASHHRLASGFKDTLEFIAGKQNNLTILDAYVDGKPVDEKVVSIMNSFPQDDEVVIFTDMTAGSVNQKFFPFIKRDHTHLIAGANLPIILSLVLEPKKDYLPADKVKRLVQAAKNELKYVNDLELNSDKDDE
ncbi:Phosphotransferase system, mannose fructose-specific component IIA [Oenococcus oeni]|uniref:PTS sugar transporter subunit IIA n=1 Tax=Oenococcus oeni TaxID=1247 RepID=UPI0010B3A259|nr:PTS N-acetylglucosamine transporter subunit IIBC [Oenococcus oeni]SYW04895.1 Phosphotransferase system, mannose fructose-specific component IIA [Oenococcus oeni]